MSQLYVGNLNPQVSEDELNGQFSSFGRITSVDVVIDPDSHAYALIDFDNPEVAKDAIRKWDGKYGWKVEPSVEKLDLVPEEDGAVVANPGNKVFIWHTGWFKKGSEWVEFGSNKFQRKPFEFRLASKDQASGMGWVRDEGIIEGWHQGIKGMRVGGKRTLTIPPYLGFGVNERGSIPGNSWLKYEIELVETYPVTLDQIHF